MLSRARGRERRIDDGVPAVARNDAQFIIAIADVAIERQCLVAAFSAAREDRRFVSAFDERALGGVLETLFRQG